MISMKKLTVAALAMLAATVTAFAGPLPS